MSCSPLSQLPLTRTDPFFILSLLPLNNQEQTRTLILFLLNFLHPSILYPFLRPEFIPPTYIHTYIGHGPVSQCRYEWHNMARTKCGVANKPPITCIYGKYRASKVRHNFWPIFDTIQNQPPTRSVAKYWDGHEKMRNSSQKCMHCNATEAKESSVLRSGKG